MGLDHASSTPPPPLTDPDDDLFSLQLRVARKADELARVRRTGSGLNLHCWLLAEAELLGAPVGGPLTVVHAAEPAARPL